MNQVHTDPLEKLREEARVAMLLQYAEANRRAAIRQMNLKRRRSDREELIRERDING